MQREIKFRGLTLEEKFKYGFLIKQGPYFFIQNDKGGNDAIIENSIGQFTGFLTKRATRFMRATSSVIGAKLMDIRFKADNRFSLTKKAVNG